MKRKIVMKQNSNLGLKNVQISEEYPKKFDRLLGGGSGVLFRWNIGMMRMIVGIALLLQKG